MSEHITVIQEMFYELRVEEVMTRDVVTVTPRNSMRDLEQILRERRISGTPVLAEGQLVGVVSIMDLIQALEVGRIDDPVRDHMTREIQVLYGDERVIAAIARFQREGYGRFPVVDRATGALIGILTQGDVIRGTLRRLDVHYRTWEAHHYRRQHFFEDVLSEDTRIILRYTIRARDFIHGGEASSQFKRSLQRLGIHPDMLRRIAVATYEAEMNLVLHATDGGTIRACVRADSIQVDVADRGPGIEDVEQAMQPGFSTAPEWIREMGFGAGMGLSNIQRCADEMSLTSRPGHGTHLVILFRLEGEEE
ncbi:MAG: CBS domain-containing protein [Anaerolineae bacterium]|nr:CBS domain-containing protein [Anaerolineae bacterium]